MDVCCYNLHFASVLCLNTTHVSGNHEELRVRRGAFLSLVNSEYLVDVHAVATKRRAVVSQFTSWRGYVIFLQYYLIFLGWFIVQYCVQQHKKCWKQPHLHLKTQNGVLLHVCIMQVRPTFLSHLKSLFLHWVSLPPHTATGPPSYPHSDCGHWTGCGTCVCNMSENHTTVDLEIFVEKIFSQFVQTMKIGNTKNMNNNINELLLRSPHFHTVSQ